MFNFDLSSRWRRFKISQAHLQLSSDVSMREFRSFREYRYWLDEAESHLGPRLNTERELLQQQESWTIDAFCFPCQAERALSADYLYGGDIGPYGLRWPNWRERLTCPGCDLNNRMRAAVHFLYERVHANPADAIYITEQVTPLYRWLAARHQHLIGSEYLGSQLPYGATSDAGVRNESVTKLTFSNASFDFILSFDVLEHVPDYKLAFGECLRCLKSHGVLLFTVPFMQLESATRVRATVSRDGSIEHVLPAQFHGDPISTAGCLCFHDFGWDMLDALREAGFSDARVITYWSRKFGYLGGEQLLFCAVK